MRLPDQIPKRLREMALFLPEFGDGAGAWSRDYALAVIEGLKGSTVAVSEVVLFERVAWGYAQSEFVLSVDRLPYEADADYAGRSRSAAADFIRGCETVGEDALFALTFPMWKDAA